MIQDDESSGEQARFAVIEKPPGHDASKTVAAKDAATDNGWVIETVVCPFHCLYQDALSFHTQSRLARSESEASRISRAALLLYVSSAEALVHQAAIELGRVELRGIIVDADRPLSLFEAWRVLPAIAAEPGTLVPTFDRESPPWPQFAELLALRTSWAYPGPAVERRAFYRSASQGRRLRTTSSTPGAAELEAGGRTQSHLLSSYGFTARPLRTASPSSRHCARNPRRRNRGSRPPHGRRTDARSTASPRARPRGSPAVAGRGDFDAVKRGFELARRGWSLECAC